MNISSLQLTDLACLLRGKILWYGQHSFSFHRQLAHKKKICYRSLWAKGVR